MSTEDRRRAAPRSGLHAALQRAVDVKPAEVTLLVMSFLYFFFVLSGYFVLRPIRDAVAAASGVQQLPWLFAGTLTVLSFLPQVYRSWQTRRTGDQVVIDGGLCRFS